MGPRKKSSSTRVMWIAILAVLLIGGVYIYFSVDSNLREYQSHADILSWTLADRVSFYISQNSDQGLDFLTGTFMLGDVVYAQVINNGLIVSQKSLLKSPLPAIRPPYGIWEIEAINVDGKDIWDVRRVVPNTNAYVRLGLSIQPLESTILIQVLMVLGFGIGLVALVVLARVMIWRRAESAKPTTDPQTTFSHEPADINMEFAETPKTASLQPSSNNSTPVSNPVNANSGIRVGDLMIDDASKRVELRGQYVELSPKEFDLILLLAKEPGRVYSNQEILARVWSDSHMATAQDVKQYVYFIRQKLEHDPKNPSLIVTVRGFGYKLQV
jgi:DNA-binding response OmpR family regulator